jgi:hypothetical protein
MQPVPGLQELHRTQGYLTVGLAKQNQQQQGQTKEQDQPRYQKQQ